MSAQPTFAKALIDALDEQALDQLAELLAPRIAAKLPAVLAAEPDGWLNVKGAATYLAMSTHALHRLTAERAIPFSQSAPGARCLFKKADLDAWRRTHC